MSDEIYEDGSTWKDGRVVLFESPIMPAVRDF
jgi:hypothetical protein